jgi:hypothetical protein
MSRCVVVGLFSDPAVAQEAVNALTHAGVLPDAISVVARDEVYEQEMPEATGRGRPTGEHSPADGHPEPAEAARLAGVDARTIPGMGSVLSAGPLLGPTSAARTGVVPAERADALLAALIEGGVARADAAACAEHVRAGGVLISFETADAPTIAEETLRRAGAVRTVAGAGR